VRTRDNVRVEVRVSASITVYSAIYSTYGKFHIIYLQERTKKQSRELQTSKSHKSSV